MLGTNARRRAAAGSVDAAKPPSPFQRKDQQEKCPWVPPYLSTKEADFTNWLNNFTTLISANQPAGKQGTKGAGGKGR
jgi:hypothetical protein